MPKTGKLLQRAIALLQQGQREDARRVLQAVLADEPQNEIAWLWMVETFPGREARRRTLERMLQYVPSSQRARQELAALQIVQGRSKTAPPRTLPQSAAPRRPLGVLVALVGICLLSVAMLYYVQPLWAQVRQLSEQNTTLQEANNLLQALYTELDGLYAALQIDYANARTENRRLSGEYTALINEYNGLVGRYNTLQGEHLALQTEYSALTSEYDVFRSTAISPPYIYIYERKVKLMFYTLGGGLEIWEVPFGTLANSIERGHEARLHPKKRTFGDGAGGEFRVVDLAVYINPQPFETVMNSLYTRIGNDRQFIHEAWNIVTQLSRYSSEIEDTPRFPLETLLAGGGDCEDTAILLASMLKAAPVDWKVSLVYMDAYNPRVAKDINHIIVYIETGTETFLVETTNDQDMEPYTDGVAGWYVEVGS